MNRSIAIVCAAGVLAGMGAAGYSQTITPPVTGTGVIRGHVRDAAGRPVPNAAVRLSDASHQQGPNAAVSAVVRVITDQTGAYELLAVPAGTYRVSAGKPPYLAQDHGQRRSFERGAVLTLADGQTLERVDVVLPRGGVVTGRVSDEFGDPIQGATILLFQIESTFGARTLTMPYGVPGLPTDDRGHYRLYAVPPGRYIVGASLPVGSSTPELGVRTYYPGILNPAEAQPVAVGLSQEIAGLDFPLVAGIRVRVMGTAADSSGRPLRGSITLQSSERTGVAARPVGVTVSADGRFEIPGVSPGEYVVKVLSVRPDPKTEPEFTAARISVAREDVQLRLQTARGVTISGRVTLDGPPSSFRPEMFTISSVAADLELASTSANGTAPVDRDAQFRLGGLIGPRRITLAAAPSGWTIKTVWANGLDLTDQPIIFKPGQPILEGVEVLVTNRAGGVAGSVSDAAGSPVTDYAVVVYAVDSSLWYEGTRFVRLARPASDGTFTAPSLPEGAYAVAAFEWVRGDSARGEWQDPAMLTAALPRATRVTVSEGRTATLSLRLLTR